MTVLPTEDAEQRALVQWLRLRGYAFHHSPNATGHTPEARRRAGRMKAAGTSAGFPDLLVFAHGKRIAIELKRQKGGRASKEQLDWLTRLANYGFEAAVCHGAAEAIEFIESVVRAITPLDHNGLPKPSPNVPPFAIRGEGMTIKRNTEVF